jgi:hypothetical protein
MQIIVHTIRTRRKKKAFLRSSARDRMAGFSESIADAFSI